MKITQENGRQFVGKTLLGTTFHYYPLKVILTKSDEVAVIDKNGTLIVVPSEKDPPVNQIYFTNCN